MNIFGIRIGAALATLLLILCVVVQADDDKKKRDQAPPPKSAPQPQPRPAPQQAAPQTAPVYHPPARTVTPQNNTSPPQHVNDERNTRHEPNKTPNPYQPNTAPNNSRPPNATPNPGYQPSNAPTVGRPTTSTPNPGYQPNLAPNNGRQPNSTNPGFQPNGTPGRAPNTGTVNGLSRSGGAAGNTPRTPPGEYTRHANGTATFRGANNSEAHFRRDGSVREVRSRDMVITHGPGGERRVFADRGDHRVVVTGRSYGYVERPFRVGGHEYANRTYYAHGVAYTRVYRSYSYSGVYYNAYVPAFYYGPTFYTWAYSPWRSPVAYRWGWAGSPWYGYYGGYFTPYPVYSSPALWLTDYVVAATLEEAYRQRLEADANAQAAYGQNYAAGGQAVLSPDVKQAIADEVQRQLSQERAEGQAVSRNPNGDPGYGGAPPLFSDNGSHVFLVSSSLEVTTAEGQECAITQGDVLGMNGAAAPNATAASVQVMASKGADCPRGSSVSVSLVDLQEMQNQMRASIDLGLADLQAHKGGLPKPPGDALKGQVQSPVAAAAPPADASASTELSQQELQASQAEQEVVGQTSSDSGADAGAAPATITLDQTIDQVVSILGQPSTVVDLGAKKIYVYKNMKVTFANGRVSDVQ
jgi:hypothetical protein